MRRRSGRTNDVGRRKPLTGTPRRSWLAGATAASAVLLATVLLLALPGDPASAAGGLASALQDPRVLVPLGIAIALASLACARRWRYRWLLRLPGPIQVLNLADATVPESEPPPGSAAPHDEGDAASEQRTRRVRLAVHFRNRLEELRLNAPTPTPGARTSTDFAELLETSKLDAKQPLAAIGWALRMVQPTHAYEVRATLLRRDEPPCHGVAVEMVTLPNRHSTLRTHWRDSWEQGLDRAATGVAAQVIPRSRHSEKGTWASWSGFELDEDLVDVFDHAQRLQGERRYEEALDLFYTAVRSDPGNGYLRFALGSMQEELALYLDALVTYRSIERVSEPASTDDQKLAAERIELIAKYRYTVLLGFGEGLAEQWLPPPAEADASRRAAELSRLRERLRPVLSDLFADTDVAPRDMRHLRLHHEKATSLKQLLDERPQLEWRRGQQEQPRSLGGEMTPAQKQQNRRLRERRLHLFFQLLAAKEVNGLLASYRYANLSELDAGITTTSLELLPSWAELRARRARHLLRDEVRHEVLRGQSAGMSARAGVKRRPDARIGKWPPSPDAIRRMWSSRFVDGSRLDEHITTSREFVDHYNAACTYALALLPAHSREDILTNDPAKRERIREAQRTRRARIAQLVDAAVAELESAATAGGSDAIAARWDWILTEDPDLAGLRGTPRFRRFESDHLPSALPAPVRPRSIVRLNASRFGALLCARFAGQLERTWHDRAAYVGPTDIHDALDWWDDEENCWALLGELARNHRHWQTRLKVLMEMQTFGARWGRPAFRIPHPRYEDRPIEGEPAAVERAARQETHHGDVRMRSLARTLTVAGSPTVSGFQEVKDYLFELDLVGGALKKGTRKKLADNRAGAWGSIRQTFTERQSETEQLNLLFEERFAEMAGSLEEILPL